MSDKSTDQFADVHAVGAGRIEDGYYYADKRMEGESKMDIITPTNDHRGDMDDSGRSNWERSLCDGISRFDISTNRENHP
jgi:hypothetical protein